MTGTHVDQTPCVVDEEERLNSESESTRARNRCTRPLALQRREAVTRLSFRP